MSEIFTAPRGINFPKPPPLPESAGLPSRSDMRRSLIIELSNEMEILESEATAIRSQQREIFETVWSEFFGNNSFPAVKNAFIFRMNL